MSQNLYSVTAWLKITEPPGPDPRTAAQADGLTALVDIHGLTGTLEGVQFSLPMDRQGAVVFDVTEGASGEPNGPGPEKWVFTAGAQLLVSADSPDDVQAKVEALATLISSSGGLLRTDGGALNLPHTRYGRYDIKLLS